MKNRKIILVAFMLAAVLMLGVGYAALTDTFSISGYAEVGLAAATTAFDNDIYFADATPTSTTGTSGVADTASVSASDKDIASFSINSLGLEGEAATFTFTVKNDSEFDAQIAITQEPSSTTGYFDTTIDFPNGTTVEAGESLSFTVTTTLTQNVTNTINASTTIALSATTIE